MQLDFGSSVKTGQQQTRYNELYNKLRLRLMKPIKQKKGDKVSLQPQLLNNLDELLKLEFTDIERASIANYELQKHLIEMAVYPKDFYKEMKFDHFFRYIVTYIRIEPKLWIKSSPMYEQVCRYNETQ